MNIEEILVKALSGVTDSRVKESMLYSLTAGGKRIRPNLLFTVLEGYGVDPGVGEPFAAAIEMIHTYSLIHDDLPAMDNDDYRRGKLTNHKVYGEAQAILAGDGLLTEAFYLMAVVGAYVPANRVLTAIAHASDLAGIGGGIGAQLAGQGVVSLQTVQVGFGIGSPGILAFHMYLLRK